MIENITDSIVYTGVDDKDIDLFESQYTVPSGISYNNYVIFGDDKTVVMDTVDQRKEELWMENLEEALDGKKPDYLVISHMEPDHSSSISKLLEKYPDMKIVGNAKTFPMLSQFFEIPGLDEKKIVVKEGDTLDLGGRKLHFFMAPMVHWPEVMVTYDDKDKVLFSADGFGKFGALDTEEEWAPEARRYYYNIVGKYGPMVQALLKKAAKLDIAKIAPLHGPVLQGDLAPYLECYQKWSTYTPEEDGTLIACASIHGNTMHAAEELKKMLEARGEHVKLIDLDRYDISRAVDDAFAFRKIVLMASSYDAGVFPPMENFLHRLVHKTVRGKKIAIIENGSWAPSAGKTMKGIVEELKNTDIVEPIVTIKSSFKESDRPAFEKLIDELLA